MRRAASAPDAEPQPAPAWFYTVAIFLCDRAYGGPEEGGWWYDCGEPIECPLDALSEPGLSAPRIFADQEAAIAWGKQLQDKLNETINKGRRSIGSILSDGEYRAVVCDGYPRAFPATKPHYE